MGKKTKRLKKQALEAARKEKEEREKEGMCQIFYCDEKKPDERLIRRESEKNDDGTGLMWFEGKKVKWVKGLTTEEGIKLLKEIPIPCAIHIRNATWGGASKQLTHPFPLSTKIKDLHALSGEGHAAIMHNGTWALWDDRLREVAIGSGGKIKIPITYWSDSMAIAFLMEALGPGILDVMRVNEGRVLYFHASDGVDGEPLVWWWGKWHEQKEAGYMYSAPLQPLKGKTDLTIFNGHNHVAQSYGKNYSPSGTGVMGTPAFTQYFTSQELTDLYQEVMEENACNLDRLPVMEIGAEV
jgi:hypothetical protein